MHTIFPPEPSRRRRSAKRAATQPANVIEAIEQIVDAAAGSELDSAELAEAQAGIAFVSNMFNLTEMQAILLAVFVDRSDDTSIRTPEIARFLGCRATRMLLLENEIDVLVDRHYIRRSTNRGCNSFSVSRKLLDALRKNQPYVYEREKATNTADLFDKFKQVIQEVSEEEVSMDNFVGRMRQLIDDIKDSDFVRGLRRCDLLEPNLRDELAIFMVMAHLYVEDNDDQISYHDIARVFGDIRLQGSLRQRLANGRLKLFERELIEFVNEDGMGNRTVYKLTEKAKRELLGEMPQSNIGKSDQDLIKPDTLVEKQLFYNRREQEQIHQLSSLLAEDRLAEIQQNLHAAGMRKGFCCLFYGAPGTGKTETVYQIARRTGRSIMRVDVDKVKSKWVGESEKNIKRLFDRYRELCKHADLAPILLFNEADAVLGVRSENVAHAVDKMENSIQNIILQEMETLDGIMIATTNLTSNLDSAFERRFLYKIKYDVPSPEARASIWQSMLKGLEPDDAKTLADKFDLSGGEIENVARKHTVQSILAGDSAINLDALIECCRQERISKDKGPKNKIGF